MSRLRLLASRSESQRNLGQSDLNDPSERASAPTSRPGLRHYLAEHLVFIVVLFSPQPYPRRTAPGRAEHTPPSWPLPVCVSKSAPQRSVTSHLPHCYPYLTLPIVTATLPHLTLVNRLTERVDELHSSPDGKSRAHRSIEFRARAFHSFSPHPPLPSPAGVYRRAHHRPRRRRARAHRLRRHPRKGGRRRIHRRRHRLRRRVRRYLISQL